LKDILTANSPSTLAVCSRLTESGGMVFGHIRHSVLAIKLFCDKRGKIIYLVCEEWTYWGRRF